jgi:YD repeat-containing protein
MQTQSFTCDVLDRLKTAVVSGGSGGTYSQKSYSYNAIGNITNFEGTAYYYQDSAHKHAVTHLGGTSSSYQKYWYDANGNQTTRKVGSNTYNLAYDAENRLTSVSGAASATFVYDGDGNRVKATFGSVTTVYVGNHYEKEGSTVRTYKAFVRTPLRRGNAGGDAGGQHPLLSAHRPRPSSMAWGPPPSPPTAAARSRWANCATTPTARPATHPAPRPPSAALQGRSKMLTLSCTTWEFGGMIQKSAGGSSPIRLYQIPPIRKVSTGTRTFTIDL